MSFRLTIWSRAGEIRSVTMGGDASVLWDEWSRREVDDRFGLISCQSEGEPPFPNKRAFNRDPLLLTSRAHEVQGGFVTSPLGGRFSGLHALRRVTRSPLVSAAPTDATDAADSAPLLPSDIIDSLSDVEVASLSGHRLVRTALIHLDVRLGFDLAGITGTDLLARLNGNRKLLETFQSQAKAYVERQEARRGQEAEAALRAEGSRASTARKAEQAAAFREVPLLESVRRSLAHLDDRNARLLARKLGLDGAPELAPALMNDFGLGRSGIFAAVNASVTTLDRLDGWPSRLKGLVGEILPISGAEMDRKPWFAGLDPERLAAVSWFGAREQVFLLQTSQGPIVGPLRTRDWDALCQDARSLVLATDLDARPEHFLERLRAGIPGGAEGYERFLLHEIGWPGEPAADWLLGMKGRISTSALVRQIADHVDGPLATGDLIEAVRAYVPGASARTMRGVVSREARHLPDGRWERRRRPDPDASEMGRVEQACVRFLEGCPDDAPTLRPASLAEAVADDPELAGIEVDADIVALAVRTSGRFAPRPNGWIVLADRDPSTDAPFPVRG